MIKETMNAIKKAEQEAEQTIHKANEAAQNSIKTAKENAEQKIAQAKDMQKTLVMEQNDKAKADGAASEKKIFEDNEKEIAALKQKVESKASDAVDKVIDEVMHLDNGSN